LFGILARIQFMSQPVRVNMIDAEQPTEEFKVTAQSVTRAVGDFRRQASSIWERSANDVISVRESTITAVGGGYFW
jgi:hypothetical protein